MISVLKVIDPGIDMGVLSGIISGLVAGALYNRFKDVKLPEYLAFFGAAASCRSPPGSARSAWACCSG